MQLRFEARLYSGRLEGEVHYAKVEGAPLWDIKTRFADLDMAQHALLRKDDKAFIRGRLGGDSAVTLTSDGQVQEGSAQSACPSHGPHRSARMAIAAPT